MKPSVLAGRRADMFAKATDASHAVGSPRRSECVAASSRAAFSSPDQGIRMLPSSAMFAREGVWLAQWVSPARDS